MHLSRLQELLQGDTKTIEDVHLLDSDNEDDDGEWMPDPIDADPCKYSPLILKLKLDRTDARLLQIYNYDLSLFILAKPSRSRKSSDIIR